jgi:hypothetical protein
MLRVACAGGTILAVFRNLDIYRGGRGLDAWQRAFHLVGIVDSRRLVRRAPRFVRSCWLRVTVFGVLTAIFTWMLAASHAPPGATHRVLRWVGAAVWAYTSIETLVAGGRALAGLVGIGLPRLHDDPILSRTLREFWGRRWNLSVRCMLHEHCFLPLVTRFGISIAVMGTFVASSLIHFWLAFAAVGTCLAASMASYFLVQGALVLLESRLGVSQYPVAGQRAWTAACLLLPLPLLLEPLLAVVFP